MHTQNHSAPGSSKASRVLERKALAFLTVSSHAKYWITSFLNQSSPLLMWQCSNWLLRFIRECNLEFHPLYCPYQFFSLKFTCVGTAYLGECYLMPILCTDDTIILHVSSCARGFRSFTLLFPLPEMLFLLTLYAWLHLSSLQVSGETSPLWRNLQ